MKLAYEYYVGYCPLSRAHMGYTQNLGNWLQFCRQLLGGKLSYIQLSRMFVTVISEDGNESYF
jgi:hypothetical protein